MEWISVKDRLPNNRTIIIVGERNDAYEAYYCDGDFWALEEPLNCYIEDGDVRPANIEAMGDINHWMPFPAPPEA